VSGFIESPTTVRVYVNVLTAMGIPNQSLVRYVAVVEHVYLEAHTKCISAALPQAKQKALFLNLFLAAPKNYGTNVSFLSKSPLLEPTELHSHFLHVLTHPEEAP
jgi:hypothetical protein